MYDDNFPLPKPGVIVAWAVGIFLAVAVGFALLDGAAFLTHSLWFQTVQAPIERQNMNHDPNWLRQVESDYQTSYTDFLSAKAALPGKIAAVEEFKKTHGPSSTWDYWTQQQYQTLYNDATGTYQAEVNEAAHYNALASDADTGPVRPTNLPAQLTPDPQPVLP